MSANPNLRLARSQPRSDASMASRAVMGVLVITQPVAAIVAVAIVAPVRWWGRHRIRGWWILLAGILATCAGLALHWQRSYWAPWHDLGTHLVANIKNPAENMWAYAKANATTWIFAQLPFAIVLGILAAGIYLAWRDRYADQWRNDTGTTKPATPKQVAKAKMLMDAKAEEAPPAITVKELSIPIGVTAIGAKPATIPAESFRTHSVVPGPTGLGKTETLERILWGFLGQNAAQQLHLPAVMINMKPDADLEQWLAGLASSTGRGYHQITVNPATSTSGYSPLAGHTADEIADMVYETVFASDPTINVHYATLSRRLLQTAAYALVALDDVGAGRTGGRSWDANLANLADLCSVPALRLAQADLTGAALARVTTYLSDVEAGDNENDVGDVRDRLAIITHTGVGEILGSYTPFNLEQAIRDGDIVCFSLDAAAAPESARTLGRLAVQDLSATFGILGQSGWGKTRICPVVLDEFSALASEKVADLYARARSAGGAVILSTQDLDADLTAVSDTFAASIRTNSNVWVVMRQTRGEMAEAISTDLGTHTTWKETKQIEDDWDLLGGIHAASGVGSLREVDEFVLHPNDIRSLPQGGAYLVVKVPVGTIGTYEAATSIQRIHVSLAPAMEARTSLPRLDGTTRGPEVPESIESVPEPTTPVRSSGEYVPPPPDDEL